MLSREMLLEQLRQYDFDQFARKEVNGRRRIRLLALAHLKEGKNCSEVADALRVTRHAVMRWMQWFATGGMARLAGVPHTWSTQRLPKAQEEAFRQAVEQLQAERGGGRVRAEEIRQLLTEQFHIEYSRNGVYHLLKRLGMAWISVRAVHPDADPAAQAEFKKKFHRKVQAILPPGVTPEQVDVWFQDEMRIGQRGTLTRIWARKGTRPRVVRQQQSEWAYIFGAFCPGQDSSIGLVLPHADTQAMAHHLQSLSAAVPAGRHAVLVLDRAGWHTTPQLPRFPNLSLLPLPACSPERNPAEQVWEQLRDRHLANRCFDDYDQIVDACCDAWNAFTQIPGAIRSLCSRSWANLTASTVTL